jgi:DNA-binding transcriptional ArsR family regulator
MTAAALQIVADAEHAQALLHPMRLRMLEHLAEPDSAAGVARKIDMPRQKANYHLRELERCGFVKQVGERRRGNFYERLLCATARSYLISPEALGEMGGDPERVRDRLSASYLVAVAGRAIQEVAVLQRRADRVGKRLATLTLVTEVRFGSAADRHAFSEELANEIARLTAKYHDGSTAGGRAFKYFLGAYPKITKTAEEVAAEERAHDARRDKAHGTVHKASGPARKTSAKGAKAAAAGTSRKSNRKKSQAEDPS